jgi:hypothetical protein
MADNALAKIARLLGYRGPDMPLMNPDVDAALRLIERLQTRAPRATEQPGDNSAITITPGVSAFDHSGYVTIAWGDESGQLTINEARAHGFAALEAAEAAEMDAGFLAFAMSRLDFDVAQAATFLKDLRDFRYAASHPST